MANAAVHRDGRGKVVTLSRALIYGWATFELPLEQAGLTLNHSARRLLQWAEMYVGEKWQDVLARVEAGESVDDAVMAVAGDLDDTPKLTATTPEERLAERNRLMDEKRRQRELEQEVANE